MYYQLLTQAILSVLGIDELWQRQHHGNAKLGHEVRLTIEDGNHRQRELVFGRGAEVYFFPTDEASVRYQEKDKERNRRYFMVSDGIWQLSCRATDGPEEAVVRIIHLPTYHPSLDERHIA